VDAEIRKNLCSSFAKEEGKRPCGRMKWKIKEDLPDFPHN